MVEPETDGHRFPIVSPKARRRVVGAPWVMVPESTGVLTSVVGKSESVPGRRNDRLRAHRVPDRDRTERK